MMQRRIYDLEHEQFRESFRKFVDTDAVPHTDDWEHAGRVDADFWRKAGAMGFLGFEAPAEFGGIGMCDFRFNAVIAEEVVDSGMAGDGFALHNDIVGPYLIDGTTDEQRARWLPSFTSGKMITAIAMTEPQAGSDLGALSSTAVLDDQTWVINGSKTFITNGSTADLVIVLARTGQSTGAGMSLIAVPAGTEGMQRGQSLRKAGRKAQDTAEIFFTECRVPVDNLIGERGRAFQLVKKNLARERLSIAITAVASARRALALTIAHCAQRSTFGVPLHRHQAVLHRLAEMHTATQVATSHTDNCIIDLNAGRLSAADAAGAKYWATDLESEVIDNCLQLFGGYGYMDEYPISRMWRDARIQRIYGGANEIMKEIVGRALIA